MIFFNSIDRPMLIITSILILGGLLILASSSMVVSENTYGTPFYYLIHQLIAGALIGIIAAVICLNIPYKLWKKLSIPIMIISLVTLIILFLPHFSLALKGAQRWIKLGPVSFQPSEFLKLAFVIYLASWLDSRKKDLGSVSYGFIPFALMLGIVGMFLAMQPDIGTLLVISVTAIGMYFIAGGKKGQLASLVFAAVVLFYLLVQLAPYRVNRILVFLHPGSDPTGIGYQINQAFIGIGSGGFTGMGYGKSIQKYNYLPEPMGDSIFAVYSEEMGLLGAVLLVGAYFFFLRRGFYIAKRAPDTYGMLLAAGITLSIIIQAFINMAAISGLLPLTGIPLPFVSYGGTAEIVTLGSIGILLNISKN